MGSNVYKFDGVNDYIEFNEFSFLDGVQPFSIEQRVKLNSFSGDPQTFQHALSSSARTGVTVKSTGFVTAGFYDGSTYSLAASSDAAIQTGVEYTIKVTYDGTNFKLFLDEVEQSGTGSPFAGATGEFLGQRSSNGWLDGNIYYTKLSDDDSLNNIVMYFDLRNRAGIGKDKVIDLSGNGNHGTSYGIGELTRTTTATGVDTSGLIYDVDADVAKFNSDKGLWIEKQRTNETNYSEDISNAYWNKTGATIVGSQLDPKGTTTAQNLVADSGTGSRGFNNSVSGLTDNEIYTWSVFVNENDFRWVRLATRNKANTIASTWFDLQNGAIGTADAGHTPRIKAYANGYYRISVGVDISSGATTPQFFFRYADGDNDSTATGTGSNYNTVWGTQIEEGEYPSSYIKTTSSAVTRTRDMPEYDATELVTQGQGSIYAEFEVDDIDTGDEPRIIELSNGSSSDYISLQLRHTTKILRVFVATGGVSQVSISGPAINIGSINKVLISYADNDVRVYLNGALAGTDTTATIATNLSVLSIGMKYNTGSQLGGYIKNNRYYPTTTSEADAIALTEL